MIFKVAKKELLSNMMDFKFFIILIISIITFAASSLVLTSKYFTRLNDYNYYVNMEQTKLKEKSGSLSRLLAHRQTLYLAQNPMEFMISGNVLFLPNTISVSPLYLEMETLNARSGQTNPLVKAFADVDWLFVIGIILSFASIVFTYDSICGEKENKTLGLILANSIKKHQVLVGKFLGGFITVTIPLLIGVIINLLIVNLYFRHQLTVGYYLKILIILAIAFIYLSFFLCLGLMVSSLSQKSITSFGILFFVWVLLVILIPRVGGILGSLFYPVKNQSQLREIRATAVKEVEEKYKDSYGKIDFSKPFARETALWVEATNETGKAVQKVLGNHVRGMLTQADAARNFSLISPYPTFKYAAENISNSGIPRVKQFIGSAKRYQQTLLSFLTEKDKKDAKSPHLLFPYFFSKQPVDYKKIPKFKMTENPSADIFEKSIMYIFLLALYTILAFVGAYVSFLRYDITI